MEKPRSEEAPNKAEKRRSEEAKKRRSTEKAEKGEGSSREDKKKWRRSNRRCSEVNPLSFSSLTTARVYALRWWLT
jgi:hypothetical protein